MRPTSVFFLPALLLLLLPTLLNAKEDLFYKRIQGSLYDQLGPLEKQDVFLREEQLPGAGIMAYYASETSAGSLYVYDRGISPIQDGVDSDTLKREFFYTLGLYRLRASGEEAVNKGPFTGGETLFTNLEIEASGQKFNLGAKKVLYARLSYEQFGHRYTEHLFLTGYRQHFWLITFAYADVSAVKSEAEMSRFLDSARALIR